MSVEALPQLAELATAGTGGLPFAKGEGTGNDFVLLPDRAGELTLTPELVRRLCDRRFGIGGDGVLRIAPADPGTWFMDYVNADGSLAEMCGNGARVYARYLVSAGWAAPGTVVLATRGGVRRVEVPQDPADDIAVDMGPPTVGAVPTFARIAGAEYAGTEISMGNPHLVCRLPALPALAADVLDLSSAPQVAAERFPDGVNVEFYVRVDAGPHEPERLVMRVHERGAGETLSCGTGACAVAVADAVARGADSTDMLVDVPGGRLRVVWDAGTVQLSGPAHIVAAGRWWG